VYALVEAGDPEADLFVRESDAERALYGCLHDEPDSRGVLSVEPVELEAFKTPIKPTAQRDGATRRTSLERSPASDTACSPTRRL
jgi:hypothetical protein